MVQLFLFILNVSMVVIQCLTGFGQHVNGSTNQNDNVQGT